MYFHFDTLRTCFREAFRKSNFSWRHLLFAVSFTALFLILRSVVWLARQLDARLYPAYGNQEIRPPLYIIGNPRSGTTFLHRLISQDDNFTHFKLLHTIFPAISFYRLSEAFVRLDSRLRNPALKLLGKVSDKGFSGWKDVHKTGPQEVESDEMLFVYTMLSPLVGLLFPYFDALTYACYVDRLPGKEREKIMGYYLDSLKRHLYATGPEKILLEKVALIAGRLGSILEALPEMRLVHMIRHPYESIPSLISMFSIPWKTFAPRAFANQDVNRSLADLIFSYYRYLLELKRDLPQSRYMEIYYDDLVADPAGTVRRIYDHFALPMSDERWRSLEQEARSARTYKSKHRYTLEQFGLSGRQVYDELRDVFEAYGFEP